MADAIEIAKDWSERTIHGGGMPSEYAAKQLARALLAQQPVVEAAKHLENTTEAWDDKLEPLFAAVRAMREAKR